MNTIRYGLTVVMVVAVSWNMGLAQNTFPDSGRVGIGTTNPSAAASWEGGKVLHINDTINNLPHIKFTSTNVAGFVGSDNTQGTYLGTKSSHGIRFETNALTRMLIDASGNIGIGTSSPSQKLDVQGDISLSNPGPRILANTENGASGLRIDVTNVSTGDLVRLQKDGSTLFNFKADGRFGIGTTSPGAKLEVAGDAKVGGDFTVGGTDKKTVLVEARSYSLPAIGTRIAFLNVPIHSVCKVEISSSENSYYQPIELYISRDGAGGGQNPPTIIRENVRMHVHSYAIGFSSDMNGDIWMEKLSFNTGRTVRLHKVEQMKGTCTILDGSTSSVGVSTDQSKQGLADVVTISGGNVGIGTSSPETKLAVNGTTQTKEIIVTEQASDWPDYVFSDAGYQMPDLGELETFIQANKHLPGIPTKKEIERDGQNLGAIQAKLLEKIEELTLYVIELEKRDRSRLARIEALERKLQQLSK